jgi:alpha-ketoglutarate-dependent taurine dioxygenase
MHTWQDAFHTDEREVAEARCRELGLEHTWTARGLLRTYSRRPGIATHAHTGERCWFNQLAMRLPTEPTGGRASASGRFRWTGLGDDAPFSAEDTAHIRTVTERHEVAWRWRAGDVLVVDNVLVQHGRRAYTGERSIVTALGASEAG